MIQMIVRFLIRDAIYKSFRGKVNPLYLGIGMIAFFFMVGLYR